MRTLEQLNIAHATDQAAGDYIGLVFAKAASNANRTGPSGIPGEFQRLRGKSVVPAMTTTDATLVQGATAYAALVRHRTLLGRLPGARPAPPLTRLQNLGTSATAGFVSENQPIPVSLMAFDTAIVMRPAKIGTITAFSDELVRSAHPASFAYIQRDLSRALALAQDLALLDGLGAEDEGRPSSVLFGVSPIGGGSPLSLEDDIVELLQTVRAGQAESPAFVASLSGALLLATARSADGARLFPGVLLTGGGDVLGVPLFISPAAAAKLILVDAAMLVYSDGPTEIAESRDSAFQLSDAPTSAAASVVSMWASNSVAIRAISYTTWALAAADAIAYVDLPLGSPVV